MLAPRRPGSSSVGGYLRKPHLLLRKNAFMARVRSLSSTTAIRNPLYRPRQVDVDETINKGMTDGQVEHRRGYAELMLGHIAARRQQMTVDAWAYFHKGDYVRALAAFEAATTVTPNDPAARFGQLMAVVANRHYMRALHKLAQLARVDEAKAAGVAGMFEYGFSLADALVSADETRTVLDGLREFAQANADNVHVQALHCFVLWYAGSDDAAIEARSIAARIKRTHPASPWAQLHAMIETARRDALDKLTPS